MKGSSSTNSPVGASPLELVQLAFISPARAVATCVFAIGLPSGLFRQLQAHLPHLATDNPAQPDNREWRIPIPQSRVTDRTRTIRTIVIDLIMLALAGVMLWRNIVIGLQSMVTWRCEYAWLLACWPIACVGWLIIATLLIHLFARKIEITYSEDAPGIKRNRLDLLLLPYRKPTPRMRVETPGRATKSPVQQTISAPAERGKDPVMIVTIQMRYSQSWRWFEAIIEALAVGIYLYATFVLTSSLFIDGNASIVYMTTMVLCLSAIRILEVIA